MKLQPLILIVFLAYDSNSVVNDISLLKLASPVTFTNYIIPACLPTGAQDENATIGLNCIISGWGETEGKKSLFIHRHIT